MIERRTSEGSIVPDEEGISSEGKEGLSQRSSDRTRE